MIALSGSVALFLAVFGLGALLERRRERVRKGGGVPKRPVLMPSAFGDEPAPPSVPPPSTPPPEVPPPKDPPPLTQSTNVELQPRV